MPKILYLVTEDWFFVSHFLPMARTARECGYDVVVATRERDHGDQVRAEGFRLVPIKGMRGSVGIANIMREFARTFDVVRSERPDVIHAISLRPIVIGGLAARLAGAKVLVLAPTGLGHLWLDGGLAARVGRNLTCMVAGTLLRGPRTRYLFENCDDSRELGVVPDDSNVTIVGGPGVDPADVPLSPEPSSPPIKIAVVSRMIEPKGITEAVEAVRRARATGAPIELHLFGDPDPENPRSISEAALRQWSAEPGITWHGRVPDVARVWREHHVAMLLSHREGLPRSLVEAAAAGRPIVATDVPGCHEVARDGKEGILVPLGDVDAAARALARLAADPALRSRMGQAANARFRERFTTEAVRQTIANLYRSLDAAADDRR